MPRLAGDREQSVSGNYKARSGQSGQQEVRSGQSCSLGVGQRPGCDLVFYPKK